MKFDICDIETGEVLGRSGSKYDNEEIAIDNALRYCKRHGYKVDHFDFSFDKRFHLTTIWVAQSNQYGGRQ